MAFLFIVLAVGVVAVSVDFTDKGECRKSITGEWLVRSPGSESFISKKFCILINI